PLQLESGGEYNIDIKVEGNKFTHTIKDEQTGKEFALAAFTDLQNSFPAGAVGFRSVAIEKFSVNTLYVRPLDTQVPK
ncbi:MAG TPA: hypothetical protein VN687_09705, partial [Blastocatellia bacterium]|nr:hypothetical protein [Blastocatellia bacterium]